MEKDKEITLNTYKKIANSYDLNHIIRDDTKKSLDDFLNCSGKGKILDIGMADGSETNYIHSKGFDVIGIDIVDEFLEIARNKYPDLTFLKMDMEKIVFPDETFNGIWANASFIHIPKERAFQTLKGFNRVLKQGGALFVSVKFGSLNGMWENKFHGWGKRHFSHYTKDELIRVFNESGFEIKEVKRNKSNVGNSWLYCLGIKI